MPETAHPTAQHRIQGALVKGIGRHRQQSDFFDVTVVVEQTEFLSHRLLLASASDFFNGLFSSGMREDLERRVVLHDISAKTFSHILDTLYFGRDILTNDNVLDVWHAANELQISFLLMECRHYLKETYVCIETCFDVYQNAKLLDCQEMVDFTWGYFRKNFEVIRRSEGILLLNHEELKKMIEDPDLIVQNEDSVVDTIMRWVVHMPVNNTLQNGSKDQPNSREEKSTVSTCPVKDVPDSGDGIETSDTNDNNEDKNRNAEEVVGATGTPNVENCSGTPNASETKILNEGERNLLESEGRNTCLGSSDSYREKGNTPTVQKSTRAEHLASLLRSCKICLLSGTNITKVLSFKIVLEDATSIAELNKAVQYHIRPDRRHDYCPPSAVHRNCSKLTTVVLAVTDKQNFSENLLVCWNMKKDGASWYGLGQPSRDYDSKTIAVCFGNNVYITNVRGNNNFWKYDVSSRNFKTLPKVSTEHHDFELVAHGDFIYAVGGSGSGLVERFNVVEEACTDESRWETIGTLEVRNSRTLCATVVGSQIVVLGAVFDEPSIIVVQSFNVDMRTSSRLENLSGSKNVVTFRKNEEAFILQGNGVLWRISPQRRGKNTLDKGVDMRQETVLWDFDRQLFGAVLYDDTLLLFDGYSLVESEWFLSVPGVFDRILNIQSPELKCYFPVAIPKSSLSDFRKLNGPEWTNKFSVA